MRRVTSIFKLAMAGMLGVSLCAGSQDSGAGGLEAQLLNQFKLTKFEKGKPSKGGTVLVVQKPGIGAISPNGGMSMSRLAGSDQASYPNNFKNGTIKHDIKGNFLGSAGSIRDLDVNEKVYVVKIEVKDASILVAVQSCGTCDANLPDPAHLPARANVNFQLGKQYLSAATPAQVADVISQVFAPDTGAAPQTTTPDQPAAAPEAPMAPMAPIPPPPPPADAPPAPPAEVKIGQTPDQVVAALGQPVQIFNVGAKMIYKYKSLKITFLNGKVTDVE